jgi:hypothetical protein
MSADQVICVSGLPQDISWYPTVLAVQNVGLAWVFVMSLNLGTKHCSALRDVNHSPAVSADTCMLVTSSSNSMQDKTTRVLLLA